MTRLLTAAVLIPLAWYACKRAPFPVFLAMALVTIGAVAWECYGVLKSGGSRPFALLGVALTLAVAWGFAGLPPHLDPLTPLTAGAVVVPVAAMLLRASPRAMWDATTSTLAPLVLVGLTLGTSVALRAVPGENGSDLLLLLLFCVALSDSLAYYVGRAVGRHKLAPTISPKKTWEGAAGGVAGSLVAALLGHFWYFQRLSLAHAVILGTLAGVAAIAGDLAESVLKRAAGVKDSSRLLPGHGGLLDRLDGLLVAAPVLYYYWRVVLSGSLS